VDETTATLIFAAIMGIGVAVWAVSLRKALMLGRAVAEPDPFANEMDDDAIDPAADTGTVTLRGDDPDTLSHALRKALVQTQFGAFAWNYKIKECEGVRLIAKKIGPILCNQSPGFLFTEADFVFERSGAGQVDCTYRLGYSRLVRKVKTITLTIILGAGLPVLCLVGGLIWFLVIPAQAPGVRWQVFQTFQIVHALWPPYLFLGI
jgi:hypothetical protein